MWLQTRSSNILNRDVNKPFPEDCRPQRFTLEMVPAQNTIIKVGNEWILLLPRHTFKRALKNRHHVLEAQRGATLSTSRLQHITGLRAGRVARILHTAVAAVAKS